MFITFLVAAAVMFYKGDEFFWVPVLISVILPPPIAIIWNILCDEYHSISKKLKGGA
jgi:ABC-type bacteriocin/lantibiotic exporter with double-glycine peptidase domain